MMSLQQFWSSRWPDFSFPVQGFVRGKPVPFTGKIVSPKGFILRADAAESFHGLQMASDYSIFLNSAFRTNSNQKRLFAAMLDAIERKKIDPSVIVVKAARPGYSDHQDGRAIDVRRKRGGREFMRRHGNRFGWYATVDSEPWHWVFKG